jgi:hypothetical protein
MCCTRKKCVCDLPALPWRKSPSTCENTLCRPGEDSCTLDMCRGCRDFPELFSFLPSLPSEGEDVDSPCTSCTQKGVSPHSTLSTCNWIAPQAGIEALHILVISSPSLASLQACPLPKTALPLCVEEDHVWTALDSSAFRSSSFLSCLVQSIVRGEDEGGEGSLHLREHALQTGRGQPCTGHMQGVQGLS